MLSSRSRASRARLLAAAAGLMLAVTALAPRAGADPSELAPKRLTLVQQARAEASQRQARGDAGNGRTTNNGISYHGGPIMVGTTHVYVIWYGNWAGSNTPTLLTTLLSNIGGSPYFNINTTYTNGAGTAVANVPMAVTQTNDALYSQGKSLSDARVQAVVNTAISSGALPSDPQHGVYFVLTSSDVTETSGFLTKYCGWHTHGTVGGADIKYSFVGDASANLSACAAQTTSPNGNPAGDAMASVVAHELEESVTDPDLNAWFDNRGYENADKCAWTFGTTYSVNGAAANMKLGGTDFLIQRNWVNASGGFCALSR